MENTFLNKRKTMGVGSRGEGASGKLNSRGGGTRNFFRNTVHTTFQMEYNVALCTYQGLNHRCIWFDNITYLMRRSRVQARFFVHIWRRSGVRYDTKNLAWTQWSSNQITFLSCVQNYVHDGRKETFVESTCSFWMLCGMTEWAGWCPLQWWRDLFRCRIDLLNFSMGFNIIAPYMEFPHLNRYTGECIISACNITDTMKAKIVLDKQKRSPCMFQGRCARGSIFWLQWYHGSGVIPAVFNKLDLYRPHPTFQTRKSYHGAKAYLLHDFASQHRDHGFTLAIQWFLE